MPKTKISTENLSKVAGGGTYTTYANPGDVVFNYHVNQYVEVYYCFSYTRRTRIVKCNLMGTPGNYYPSYIGLEIDDGGGRVEFTEDYVQSAYED